MKKLFTLLLCLMLALSTAAFVGCKETPDTGSTPGPGDSTPDTPPVEDVVDAITSVKAPLNIVDYNTNKGERENEDNQFFVMNRTFTVGDDNAFIYMPTVGFINEDREPVTPESWTFTYELAVKQGEEFIPAEATMLESFDNVTCAFDFAAEAVGKTFKLTVTPDGLASEQVGNPAFSSSFEFDVVDGYNVYSADELAYMSNYDVATNITSATNMHSGWKTFREEKGLTLNPSDVKALIIQNDLVLTAENIPASFLYTAEEVAGETNAKYLVGTLKEDPATGIYHRHLAADDSFTLYGNYYNVDASGMPYVLKMSSGWTTEVVFDSEGTIIESNVISHASLFYVDAEATDAETASCMVRDLDIVGNSPKSEDLIVQGGLIFFKGGNSIVTVDNSLSKCFFISFFGQKEGVSSFKNIKCFDSFNSPLYNWACDEMYLDNCYIVNAGGPAMIADTGTYSGPEGTSVTVAPRIIATNCEFDNYVVGNEAWFIMALGDDGALGASSMIAQIKALDALPRGMSAVAQAAGMQIPTRTFLKDVTINEAPQTMMNIICVVKDDGDRLGENNTTYIEYNGAVLDYGRPGKDTDKTNDPENPYYETALSTYMSLACRGQGAPIIETSGGGALYYNPNVNPPIGEFIDPTTGAKLIDYQKALLGDKLNIYYHTGSSAFGTIGIMLDYFNVEA